MAIMHSRKRPENLKKTLKRFLSYIGKHKFTLFIVGILAILSAFSNLLGTYNFQTLIDKYTRPEYYDEIWKMILLEVIIYSVGVISTLIYTQIMCRVAQKIIYEMRHDMFNRMECLPLSYFDDALIAINSITPQEIRNLAEQYLCKENLKEVVAGKKI